jgi:photosystem II stability/assembly factor-like uncharacterized protein
MHYPHTMRKAAALILFLTATTHAQFQIQQSHTTASLSAIHALSNDVVWASGTRGTILRTTNGGANWQACITSPNAGQLDFRAVYAFDANTAIVMSSGRGPLSRLYKTTDACRTWKLLFINPDKDGSFDAIKFRNRDEGVLLGSPVDHAFAIRLTFDGGDRWESQTLLPAEDLKGETTFAASNSTLLVMANDPGYRAFCTGGLGGPRLISFSSKIGSSYAANGPQPGHASLQFSRNLLGERFKTTTRRKQSSGCHSIAKNTNNGTAVAVGGDDQAPDNRIDTAWTTDLMDFRVGDPSMFHPAQTPPHGYRSSVAFDAATNTFITVGPNGTDISRDDGRTWIPFKPNTTGPHPDSPNADKNWSALSLPFAVGPNGRIGKLNPNALTQAAKP